MQNLLIEQRGPQGLQKTWRLRSEQGQATFGTSKHADLRSPETSAKGIQGLFEFRNGVWRYISLDLNQQNLEEPVEKDLTESTELRIGASYLRVVPFESRKTLFSDLDSQAISKKTPGSQAYQIFLVQHGNQILETQILSLGSTFVSKYDPAKTKISTQEAIQWIRIQLGDFEISQRTVFLSAEQAKQLQKTDRFFDSGSKKLFIPVFVASLLLGLMFLLSPSSRDASEAAKNSIPPEIREARLVIPKKKKTSAGIPTPQPIKAQQAPNIPTPSAGPAAAPNRLSALKSLSTSRISQLIGKVSATSAKSQNIIVSQGTEAGNGPSGSALSALGKRNQEGKDWKTNTPGVTVSTVGNAGGTKGMGKLAVGKTGSGGAELLEDESEVSGGLDKEVIAQYIRSQLGQILYCYERQLSAQPNLYGKIAVSFTIGPVGTLETQRISETSLKSTQVEGCILQKVAKWKFPAPEGGTRVKVTYPFLFKSTN